MQPKGSSKLFAVALVVAAAFVWLSSRWLPPVVASHFGASGVANGFMPRQAYTWFMVVLITVVPSLLVFLPNRVMASPGARFNLPNKSYWLAPERRQETIEYLCGVSRRFGYLLACFLAYVHGLVVKANAAMPPVLSSGLLVGGLVVFVLAMALSAAGIFRRFGRVPQ